jgi:transcription elongation GreA/GreB family factor
MAARTVDTVRIPLTEDGFQLILDRVNDIKDRQLPELRPFLYGPDRDETAVARFEDLLADLAQWEGVLARVSVMPESSSTTVVLGSRVRVQLADGTRTWVRPVHPVEAALDDERISVDSPLGAALLGCRANDEVLVAAPAGEWTCRILDVPRVRKSRQQK